MNIPKDYICSITHEIMRIPVILVEDSNSYERSALQAWLNKKNTSPLTNNELTDKKYVLNRNLKNSIEHFLEQYEKSKYVEEVSHAILIKNGPIPDNMRKDHQRLKITIVLLGDSDVGKSSILQRLRFGDKFSIQNLPNTIGMDIYVLHLKELFDNRYAVSIHVLDIPGANTQFVAVWPNYFRRCHGAFLVVDVTQFKTLENIKTRWYKRFQKLKMNGAESILLCNKIDIATKQELDNDEIQTFIGQAEEFANKNEIPLFNTSALTGKNIQTVFNQMVLTILNNDILLQTLINSDSNVLQLEEIKLSPEKKCHC